MELADLLAPVPGFGSPVETISVFYALTRTASGWKFFVVSDIIILHDAHAATSLVVGSVGD